MTRDSSIRYSLLATRYSPISTRAALLQIGKRGLVEGEQTAVDLGAPIYRETCAGSGSQVQIGVDHDPICSTLPSRSGLRRSGPLHRGKSGDQAHPVSQPRPAGCEIA